MPAPLVVTFRVAFEMYCRKNVKTYHGDIGEET